jgi:hypothetical protein
MPTLILPISANAQQRTIKTPFQAPVLTKKVSIQSVAPKSIILIAGGQEVAVTITGANVNQITAVQVIEQGKLALNIEAKLEAPSTTSMVVYLKAKSEAKLGSYQLRVIAGAQSIEIPTNIVSLELKASTYTALGIKKEVAQVAPRPLQTGPTILPPKLEPPPAVTTKPQGSGDDASSRTAVGVKTEKVISPKDGDRWRREQSYNIQWEFISKPPGGQARDLTSGNMIDVDLINTNGQKIADIVQGIGLKSYKWTVPSNLADGVYRISVAILVTNNVSPSHQAQSSVFYLSSNVPLTVRNSSQYDVNQVWLRCSPVGTPNLVIPDLTQLLPITGNVAPRYDTSKVIEVPQGSLCNLDYIQERLPLRPPLYCPSTFSTTVFRAGIVRFPGSTILRETITIFDHTDCSILKNWTRMEQIFRSSDGKVYRYLIYAATGDVSPSKNPILLDELLAQGYGMYNSNEFNGKFEPYSASQ